ncbi:MAG: TonB-dependent receptor [Tannerella sp.]|jgi:TonB-linked SusC/RagA family outer membrane protein|nr:TonB-dependent receptor [Tannerella sp.]
MGPTVQSGNRTVKGTVVDENNEPIPGVNVVIKSTRQGVATNIDGIYSIVVPDNNAVLIFSYIGYATREITVGNQTEINVTLTEDTRFIDEVVVIGYGSQSREMITSSISKLETKVLENVPYTHAGSALQGAVSGVRVQSTSGQPGEAPRIIIRGGTSINNPNGAAPLYIIDGVMRPQMVDISGDDIESIQVLKDAAATSIYGALGSNGVVIITTKSGKSGKTQISYKYNLTLSEVGKLYKMASARDFLTLTRTGLIADSKFDDNTARLGMAIGYGTGNDLTNNTAFSTQYLTDANRHKLDEGWQSMPDPVDPLKTLIFSETDFQDLTYKIGVSHNHHVEVSGGNEKATFNSGLGYLTNEGTVINTNYKRLSFNLNGTLKAGNNLTFTSRVLYSNSTTNKSPYGGNVTFYRSAGLPPTAKVRFEDGTLAPGANQSIGNPLYHMYNVVRDNRYENLTISLGADWRILPQLTFSPQVSMYNVNSDSRYFQPGYWNGPLSYVVTRNANASNYRWLQYQAEAVLNYTDTYFDDHNVNVMGGFSYYDRNTNNLSAAGRGASTDNVPTLNASSEPTSVSSSVSDHLMIGYFARLNYNYKHKYVLSANVRYDGASNLGDNNQWGVFPGVSAGWHLDKEDFWDFLPKDLLRIKLRASYGVNGNISGLDDFTAQGAYSVGSKYMGNAGIVLSTMANSDLKWERSKTTDIGTDINLFDDRISIMFDYFNRVTDNLITDLSLPPSTGFSSIKTNLGSLRNRGVEFELNAQVIRHKKLNWNLGFNASKVKNKILKLPDNGTENNRVGGFYVWDDKIKDYAWKGGLQEGGTPGDLYAYKQVSIFATDEEAAKAPVDMIMTIQNRTKFGGDVNWLDADNNGMIDDKDRVYLGNPYPKWTGGISNTLNYSGIEFYVRMDYTTGHTIYNYAKAFLDYNWQGDNVMTQDVVNRSWKKQGDITDMPRHYWAGDRGQQNNIRGNSIFYEPGDFLCLREVSLSYSLPSSLLNKIKISNLRLSITGNNLHYFTKYKGLNPEDGGQDDGRYAMPVNLIFGANITF